jgi:hypothetical protein
MARALAVGPECAILLGSMVLFSTSPTPLEVVLGLLFGEWESGILPTGHRKMPVAYGGATPIRPSQLLDVKCVPCFSSKVPLAHRRPHRPGLCADPRGPPPISEESRCRMFCRATARPEELRQERTTDAHQQETSIYGRCWCRGRTTFWDRLAKIVICGAGGRNSRREEGKNAKKRAVVAVAGKLAVLLHRLWVSGEVYEPLRNSQKVMNAAA